MFEKLHILLTYNCSLRCKHCYVFSDQRAHGKISLKQINQILKDASRLSGVRWVYFGGGEPFTQYPLLLKSVQRARKFGYDVGVETNGYFARSIKTGIRFLRPLADMGINDIRISNDPLHYKNAEKSPASKAVEAALNLGIPTTVVRIPSADNRLPVSRSDRMDHSLQELRLMYAGRAAKTLLVGRKTYQADHYLQCPREDLEFPDRLYIDAYGFVQTCPGIAIGNIQKEPLDRIVNEYIPKEHKIIQPLLELGPLGLVRKSQLHPNQKFADECHCCYSARRDLLEVYPELLGPRQVYGY
jgi:hypothetical protein